MTRQMKKLILGMSPVLDLLSAPIVLFISLFLKLLRRYGIARLPLTRGVFRTAGVFPVLILTQKASLSS